MERNSIRNPLEENFLACDKQKKKANSLFCEIFLNLSALEMSTNSRE